MANLTGGLCQIVQINGMGLVTDGFLWQAGEVWFYPESMDGLSTGWTAALGYSGSATLVATTWSYAAENEALDYAGGIVGFYRATSAYGTYSIPFGTVVETTSGVTLSTNNVNSFTASNVATFATSGTVNASVGAVYSDQNGNHFTILSNTTNVNQLFTTDGAHPPYGLGTYLSSIGGVLTKVSGVGDSHITYVSVSDTDFYITSNIVAVNPGVESNVTSENEVTILVSSLADTAITILDSSDLSGGLGIYTPWTVSTAFGLYENPG